MMTTLGTQGLASCNTSARRPFCGGAARLYRDPGEGTSLRAFSHYSASTSYNTPALSAGLRSHGLCSLRRRVVAQALFDPPPFQPEKLAVVLAAGTTALEPAPPLSRKYTLTHNDITANLRLTIGPDYNERQISGFYTRLLRDEVVAEWVNIGTTAFALHVYCHVSGEERWLAPPLLRNYIFRREMPLVLETLVYADQQLLRAHPELAQAQVYVHFQSSVKELDTVECWGILGDRNTWPKGPTSILLRMIYAVVGWPSSMPPLPADLSVDLPIEIRDVEEAVRLQQQRNAAAAELEVLLLLEKQQDTTAAEAVEATEDDVMQLGGQTAQQLSRTQGMQQQQQQVVLERRLHVAEWQQAVRPEAGQRELVVVPGGLDELSQVADAAVTAFNGWNSRAGTEATDLGMGTGQLEPSSLELTQQQQQLVALQTQGRMAKDASQAAALGWGREQLDSVGSALHRIDMGATSDSAICSSGGGSSGSSGSGSGSSKGLNTDISAGRSCVESSKESLVGSCNIRSGVCEPQGDSRSSRTTRNVLAGNVAAECGPPTRPSSRAEGQSLVAAASTSNAAAELRTQVASGSGGAESRAAAPCVAPCAGGAGCTCEAGSLRGRGPSSLSAVVTEDEGSEARSRAQCGPLDGVEGSADDDPGGPELLTVTPYIVSVAVPVDRGVLELAVARPTGRSSMQ